MLDRFTEKIINKLAYDKVIDGEDAEIYSYGLRQLISLIVFFIAASIVMVAMNEVLEGIIFLLGFFSIRQYAGGYHSPSRIGCFFISLSTLIVALVGINYLCVETWISVTLLVMLLFAIILMSPVESINKPLDEIEQTVFRKRTIIITVIEFIFAVFFLVGGLTKLSNTVIISFSIIIISMICGRITLQVHSGKVKC